MFRLLFDPENVRDTFLVTVRLSPNYAESYPPRTLSWEPHSNIFHSASCCVATAQLHRHTHRSQNLITVNDETSIRDALPLTFHDLFNPPVPHPSSPLQKFYSHCENSFAIIAMKKYSPEIIEFVGDKRGTPLLNVHSEYYWQPLTRKGGQ